MKKNLVIFCVAILGIFFINNNCFAICVAEVVYKEFKTNEWNPAERENVVIKLILYSESISRKNKRGLRKFDKYQNLIKKVAECYDLKGWEKNNNPNFSNFIVRVETIEFFINTDRKHDVIWAYLWACDLSKLFNKDRYWPKKETYNEFFNEVLEKTEEEIKRKYNLK